MSENVPAWLRDYQRDLDKMNRKPETRPMPTPAPPSVPGPRVGRCQNAVAVYTHIGLAEKALSDERDADAERHLHHALSNGWPASDAPTPAYTLSPDGKSVSMTPESEATLRRLMRESAPTPAGEREVDLIAERDAWKAKWREAARLAAELGDALEAVKDERNALVEQFAALRATREASPDAADGEGKP